MKRALLLSARRAEPIHQMADRAQGDGGQQDHRHPLGTVPPVLTVRKTALSSCSVLWRRRRAGVHPSCVEPAPRRPGRCASNLARLLRELGVEPA
jgi:hypothetical protein